MSNLEGKCANNQGYNILPYPFPECVLQISQRHVPCNKERIGVWTFIDLIQHQGISTLDIDHACRADKESALSAISGFITQNRYIQLK